ncbi:MAG: IPT/TIG domain-containing protein [Prolixibacteraceae bacterium]
MKNIYLSLLFLLTWIACRKEDEARDFPELTTSSDLMITNDGVIFSARIEMHGGSTIIDHGAVFFLKEDESAGDYNRISLGKFPGGNSFTVNIDRNLQEGKDYGAKAYLQTEVKTVYGNPVYFVSKGSRSPKIKNFSPEEAFVGDTVEISGEYFASRNLDNIVCFGNSKAAPFSSCDTLLKVVVPTLSATNIPLKIEVAGKLSEPARHFSLRPPVIKKYAPAEVLPGEDVKISGKGFLQIDKLSVDDREQYVKSKTDSTLVFTLNYETGQGQKQVRFFQIDRTVIAEKNLEVIFPQISEVSPKIAWIDTIITIRGTNVDKLTDFKLNDGYLEMISRTPDEVKLKVRSVFSDGPIYAWFYRNSLVSEEIIGLNPPVIISSTGVTHYGETIRLKGERFFYGLSSPMGSFEYQTENEATLTINWELSAGSHPILLSYNGRLFSTGAVMVNIPKIEVTATSPYEIKRGSEITILAENLPPRYNFMYMKCYLDQTQLTIKSVSEGMITAVIPDYAFSSSEYPDLTLEVGLQKIILQGRIHLNEKWKLIPGFSGFGQATALVEAGGQVYAFSYSPGEYQKGLIIRYFDPGLEKWIDQDNVKLPFSGHTECFSLGPDVFIMGNDKSLFKYSATDKSWIELGKYPDDHYSSPFAFVVNGQMYIGTTKSFYQYEPVHQSWIRKSDLPTTRDMMQYPLTFSAADKGYLAFFTGSGGYDGYKFEYNEFWEYDPSSENWKNLGSMPLSMYRGGSGALYNGKVYLAGRSYHSGDKISEFDPATYQFREMIGPPGGFGNEPFLFVRGNYLYFVEQGGMYKIPLNELPKIYK